jgi:hypothetical protein
MTRRAPPYRCKPNSGCSPPFRLAPRQAGLFMAICAAALPMMAAGGVHAEPVEPCDVLGDIAAGSVPRLHRVGAGRKRLHFSKSGVEQAGCPGADAACAETAYVVAGDPVLVSETAGDYVCAAFGAPDGMETSGWLPAAALEEVKEPAKAPRDWLGQWQAGEWRRIKITAAGKDNIELEGEAYWGAGDPVRRANGAVHTGEIGATIRPNGGQAAFSLAVTGEVHDHDAAARDIYCRVRLWRLGPYLAVTDNVQCGGANVSFTGIYRRAGGKRRWSRPD